MNRLFEDATKRRAAEAEASDEVEGADWYPAAEFMKAPANTPWQLIFPESIEQRSTSALTTIDDNKRNARWAGGNAAAQRVSRGKFLRTFSVPARWIKMTLRPI